jgi:hypothetical protein
LNGEITKQQNAVKDLSAQIAAKDKQLETAHGERDLLTRELKNLMTKRTELERQLRDLAFLREQIAHLKAEDRTARRFAAARTGTLNDERKGAQLLIERSAPTAAPPAPAALVVELRNDGTVHLELPSVAVSDTSAMADARAARCAAQRVHSALHIKGESRGRSPHRWSSYAVTC